MAMLRGSMPHRCHSKPPKWDNLHNLAQFGVRKVKGLSWPTCLHSLQRLNTSSARSALGCKPFPFQREGIRAARVKDIEGVVSHTDMFSDVLCTFSPTLHLKLKSDCNSNKVVPGCRNKHVKTTQHLLYRHGTGE